MINITSKHVFIKYTNQSYEEAQSSCHRCRALLCKPSVFHPPPATMDPSSHWPCRNTALSPSVSELLFNFLSSEGEQGLNSDIERRSLLVGRGKVGGGEAEIYRKTPGEKIMASF
jgi:hypothetical protein